MENDKISELEKRILILEQKLNSISFNETNEVTMTNCPIGDVHVGSNCNIHIQNSPVGSVFDSDIDGSECRLDDLENRLDEINSRIDEAEAGIDELDD